MYRNCFGIRALIRQVRARARAHFVVTGSGTSRRPLRATRFRGDVARARARACSVPLFPVNNDALPACTSARAVLYDMPGNNDPAFASLIKCARTREHAGRGMHHHRVLVNGPRQIYGGRRETAIHSFRAATSFSFPPFFL